MEVYSTETVGSLEMLNFEALEIIKNKYFKDSFDSYIEENPKYKTYVKSLVTKAHSYMSNLQSRLGRSSEFSQSNDETSFRSGDGTNKDSSVKESILLKELTACLLFLGKYYKGALLAVLEENQDSTLQRFETSKMIGKAYRTLKNIGELMPDEAIGLVYTLNNLGYLLKKLLLLEQTSYFKVFDFLPNKSTEGQEEKKRFDSTVEAIQEDMQNMTYSLSRIIWENASKHENLSVSIFFSSLCLDQY